MVVVAAGNDGRKSNMLASPALDPYVIAVGAVEAKKDGSFKVPSWASSGDGVRNPDLAAPGAHIDSLRAPLSRVDLEHPEGYVDEFLFRGSGSSQAAAVVSGAVALLLDADPNLTPDQVKALLTGNTRKASPDRAKLSGSGVVQVDKAVAADQAANGNVPPSTQSWTPSDGTGLLEAARGPLHMVINGVEATQRGSRRREHRRRPWTGATTERRRPDRRPLDAAPGWATTGWSVRWTGVRWTRRAAGPASAGPTSCGKVFAGPACAGPVARGTVSAGPASAGRRTNGRAHRGRVSAGPVSVGPTTSGPRPCGTAFAGPAYAGPVSVGTVSAGRACDGRT